MELRSKKIIITLKDPFADVTIERPVPATNNKKGKTKSKRKPPVEAADTSQSDEETPTNKRTKREVTKGVNYQSYFHDPDNETQSSDYDDSKPLRPLKRSKSVTPVKKRKKKSRKTRASLPSIPKIKEFNPTNHKENFPVLSEFYESLRPTYTQEIEQPARITAKLHPYQRRAVSWMIQRETQLENSIKGEIDDFCRGGILADEMGLGKTIELLSLVVSNPMTHDRNNLINESITSHHCEEDSTIPIKATLIIMPSTLIFQWKKEIAEHAPSLKVKEYNGMQSIPNYEKFKTKKQYRRIFGDSDIVITSYEVLRTEVNYVDDHSMSLRDREETTTKLKTPLVKMRWWRVCLDEAQMTKTKTTATARMALHLHTIYRWCVSGTPVQNGITDLKGLLLFLKSGSYWNMSTVELIAFLKRIMWRHAREHVKNEIEIPSPTDTALSLELSPIEQFCYKKMQDIEVESKVSMAKFFSLPFPVINDALNKKKKTKLSECDLSMTFTSLIDKCRNDYWNSQLELCNSLNDIAAVYYDDDPNVAGEYYKNALSLEFQKDSDYYDIYGKTDIESEIVVRPTNSLAWQTAILRSLLNYSMLSNYSQDLEGLEDKINNAKVAALTPATFAFEKSYEKLGKIKDQINIMLKNESRSPFGDPFYIRALDYFAERGRENFILRTLRKGHMQKVSSGNIEYQETLILKEATSLENLKLFIKEGLSGLQDMRKSLLRNLKTPLCTKFEEIESFRELHMKAEQEIREYKTQIIPDELEKSTKNTDVRKRKLSLVERVLLFLEHELIQEYNLLMAEVENQNFTNKATFDRVGLILEEISYRMNIFNVQAKEISDIMITWTTREKYLDVLLQLAFHSSRMTSDLNKDIVMDQLAKKQDFCKVKRKELEFILTESKKKFPRISRYGSKLEKITRDITDVTIKEPGAKMLVFSQWNEALSQLAKLLQENNINYVSAKTIPETPSHGSVSDRINSFKENPEIVVCLLNTEASQSTGLTLTQANHVFIMDVVDNANDLQAIGRIHRIGQNKPTFVHRYVFAEEMKVNNNTNAELVTTEQ